MGDGSPLRNCDSRLAHNSRHFRHAPMVFRNGLVVRFPLRIELPLGVEQPEEVEVAACVVGDGGIQTSLGRRQDLLLEEMDDSFALGRSLQRGLDFVPSR